MTNTWFFAAFFVISAMIATSANAEVALVISSKLQAKDASGKAVELAGHPVGSTIDVSPNPDGTLSIGGEITLSDSSALAFELGKRGCFGISIEKAVSEEAKALWEVREIEGRDEYFGPSLDLRLAASASLSAGVELCLVFDKPLVLKPKDFSGRIPQSMVATQFWEVSVGSGKPVSRVEISPSIKAGVELEAKLDAYCMHPDRRTPGSGDFFELQEGLLDWRLETVLSNPNGLEPGSLLDCVWAARAFSDEFARDVIDDRIRQSFEDGERLSEILKDKTDLRNDLLSEHWDLVSLCPSFTKVSYCDESCMSGVRNSEPWSVEQVEQLIRDVHAGISTPKD